MPKRFLTNGVPEAERFAAWSKPDPSGCLLWQGALDRKGYGHFRKTRQRVQVLAHRYAWEAANGPIPDGLLVCHKCDVPRCVNVEHLFLGTAKDNIHDMLRKGRGRAGDKPGEESGSAKLTNEQVLAIRASAEISRIVAARYGVALQTIYAIRKRKTWKHI